jgi:hypothetical protein
MHSVSHVTALSPKTQSVKGTRTKAEHAPKPATAQRDVVPKLLVTSRLTAQHCTAGCQSHQLSTNRHPEHGCYSHWLRVHLLIATDAHQMRTS